MTERKRVLVLGATGLIGAAICRALRIEGHEVVGLARTVPAGAGWLRRDIAQMRKDEWLRDLTNIDVVVNAAGALQDGLRDDLHGVHVRAIERLCATAGQRRIVQISAAGVSDMAATAFMRTKAQGDALLIASGVDAVILRPVLVIAPQAYGGTALLRAVAALPYLQPGLFENVPVQTVAVEDVARATCQAVSGDIAAGTVAELTEDGIQDFPALLVRMRAWLGFAPWRVRVPVPDSVLRIAGKLADMAGRLGWLSPLRSTAIATLRQGITGDPHAWQAAGGAPCRSLDETFAALPATVQERRFARMYLMLPLAIVTLSLFWLLSGIIGLLQLDAARAVLAGSGVEGGATLFVLSGAVVDMILGLLVLHRRWAGLACQGMIAVSLAYLFTASLFVPVLWLDPLGPMVKVLPGIGLAALVLAMLDER